MLEQMLSRYTITSKEQQLQALREVMQEIALAGLYRSGFFDKAAFYGGTCLRIFYQLPRYSEDLDFSLMHVDEAFNLEPYFQAIVDEFAALGVEVVINRKAKSVETAIESAFLKNTTQVFDISLSGPQIVKIKLEVDTQPPLGFATEEKLLLEPYSFYVKCFRLPDLFAGKMHALLFRQWRHRVKGRDWFDFEWYVRKRVPLNLSHFNQRALQSGDIVSPLDAEGFRELLLEKVQNVDLNSARQDIERFIVDGAVLAVWSSDYFTDLAGRLIVEGEK